MDLAPALADAKARLADRESTRAEIDLEIQQLRDEIRGLELALARHTGVIHPKLSQNGWSTMPRTAAVERLLRESDSALGPTEIFKELRRRGRLTDHPRYVSAALAYLKGKGAVRSEGGGKWAAATRDHARDELPVEVESANTG